MIYTSVLLFRPRTHLILLLNGRGRARTERPAHLSLTAQPILLRALLHLLRCHYHTRVIS